MIFHEHSDNYSKKKKKNWEVSYEVDESSKKVGTLVLKHDIFYTIETNTTELVIIYIITINVECKAVEPTYQKFRQTLKKKKIVHKK